MTLHKINSFRFRYTLYNIYKKTAIYACTHKRAEKKISAIKVDGLHLHT